MSSIDEAVLLLYTKVNTNAFRKNINEIKEELNMVRTKQEVEDIWDEAKEVVEPVNLPPVMTDDSTGIVDEIMVL